MIKSYSPNLMVHPYLYEADNVPSGENKQQWVQQKVLPKITKLLERIHVAVLGPGLGRDALMLSTLEQIIQYLKNEGKPMIIDADGLYLISQKPEIIKGYAKAILTPNVVEFKRLADAVGVKHDDPEEETRLLAEVLGVIIVRKASEDLFASGDVVIKSSVQGSNRRAGGQGDTLTGTIATLVAWGQAYTQGIWEHSGDVHESSIPLLACFGGSLVTRHASRLAFQEVGRAMQATDVHAKVGQAYALTIEDDSFVL